LSLFSSKQYQFERDLLRCALAGDSQASKEIIRLLSPPAFSLAWRMLGSKEDAEDVVQEAFIRLWRSADSFLGKSKLLTYFYPIVSNLCLDRLKANSRVGFDEFDEGIHLVIDELDFDQNELIDSGAIGKALDTLSAKQRMAIMMWAYQDQTAQQIGVTLGMNKNSVDQLLYRAKLKLKTELERV